MTTEHEEDEVDNEPGMIPAGTIVKPDAEDSQVLDGQGDHSSGVGYSEEEAHEGRRDLNLQINEVLKNTRELIHSR